MSVIENYLFIILSFTTFYRTSTKHLIRKISRFQFNNQTTNHLPIFLCLIKTLFISLSLSLSLSLINQSTSQQINQSKYTSISTFTPSHSSSFFLLLPLPLPLISHIIHPPPPCEARVCEALLRRRARRRHDGKTRPDQILWGRMDE